MCWIRTECSTRGLFPGELTWRRRYDAERGAHCTNPDCIMYFASEAADDLKDFVNRIVPGAGDTNALYDQACRDDAAAAAQ